MNRLNLSQSQSLAGKSLFLGSCAVFSLTWIQRYLPARATPSLPLSKLLRRISFCTAMTGLSGLILLRRTQSHSHQPLKPHPSALPDDIDDNIESNDNIEPIPPQGPTISASPPNFHHTPLQPPQWISCRLPLDDSWRAVEIKPFDQRTKKLAPGVTAAVNRGIAGMVSWVKGNEEAMPQWKYDQCDLAMDQYLSCVFQMARWEPEKRVKSTDPIEARKEALAQLYMQFDLQQDSQLAPLLRDALRLLLDCDIQEAAQGDYINGPDILSTSRHRMFKELLDLIPSVAGYEELANEFGMFKRNGVSQATLPDDKAGMYLQMQLAQNLAKAFYTRAKLREFSLHTLNGVCLENSSDPPLFKREISQTSLSAQLAYERTVIGSRAKHHLPGFSTQTRKLGAVTATNYFNPTSQANIPEQMWRETYQWDKQKIERAYGGYVETVDDNPPTHYPHQTLQLRCPTPTASSFVVGSFKLFLDSLWADNERLMYCSLQDAKGYDEGPRVQLLIELAQHKRYQDCFLLLRFPMDGPFWKKKNDVSFHDLDIELMKELGATERASIEDSDGFEVVVDIAPGDFHLPIQQMRKWYQTRFNGEFNWGALVKQSIHEAKAQYFPDSTYLSSQERRAFITITYAKVLKRLRPLMNIQYAIEGCKDDQDRGATQKAVHLYDNLVLLGRKSNLTDLLNLRLIFHRAAWFNKSQAILTHGRADVAEKAIQIMEKENRVLPESQDGIALAHTQFPL